MRITGGTWRGRRLQTLPGSDVRPTSDRVREAVFNIVAAAVPGAAVADLCCGNGSLGLEALSRGAAHVDFVDRAPACLAVVRENLQRCGAPEHQWSMHRADAVRWLRRRLAQAGPPLLVLADPPYAGDLAEDLARILVDAGPGMLLGAVLEHSRALAVGQQDTNGGCWRLQARSYGRTTLTLLRPRLNGRDGG
jgi:16S rRNA (guanine(966)-N(2))-methyltransferase RsmD